jgi:ABC-2 type transport system ATP-binding protein
MKYTIECSNLSKSYGKIVALKNFSVKVEKIECFGLFGPNGAGKSTIISILSTLISPTAGGAKINGFDIISEKRNVKLSISVMFQDPTLDDSLTGRENLMLYSVLKKSNNSTEDILELVELNERIDDLVKTYSYGMKRRLEIARCLVVKSPVIFLDEPTRSLDNDIRTKILNYLKDMQKESTLFIATHSIHEAKFLCDKVGLINNGNLLNVCKVRKLEENVDQYLGKNFEVDTFA